MKTNKFTAPLLAALTLAALTATLVMAAPPEPGKQADSAVNAPIPQRSYLQAHSEAWNDYYFDRYVNSSIPARTGSYVSPLKWQGGMAKGANNGY